jgi:MFS family permease
MAVLGIFSLYLLSRIEYNEEITATIKKSLLQSIKGTLQNMKMILKSNKAFYDFEMGFMWYGFAFMGTVSVIAIYFTKGLHLNYTSLAFYKNSYNILAIVLLPFFGRLIGKIDPRKFAAITFASLLFYILFILLTQYLPYQTSIWNIQIYWFLIIAITSNGIFAATMSLLWSIGSAYFCKKEDAADYQAIHLSFTGLRSFFAPLLGVIFYQWFGFTITFLIGIAFLLISILLMIYSMKFRR